MLKLQFFMIKKARGYASLCNDLCYLVPKLKKTI